MNITIKRLHGDGKTHSSSPRGCPEMSNIARLCMVGFMTLAVASLHAADLEHGRGKARVFIDYSNVNNAGDSPIYRFDRENTERKAMASGDNEIKVPRNTDVQFVWKNTNPVLFLYETRLTEPVLTPNAEALKAFAEKLKGFGALIPSAADKDNKAAAPKDARSNEEQGNGASQEKDSAAKCGDRGSFALDGFTVSDLTEKLAKLGVLAGEPDKAESKAPVLRSLINNSRNGTRLSDEAKSRVVVAEAILTDVEIALAKLQALQSFNSGPINLEVCYPKTNISNSKIIRGGLDGIRAYLDEAERPILGKEASEAKKTGTDKEKDTGAKKPADTTTLPTDSLSPRQSDGTDKTLMRLGTDLENKAKAADARVADLDQKVAELEEKLLRARSSSQRAGVVNRLLEELNELVAQRREATEQQTTAWAAYNIWSDTQRRLRQTLVEDNFAIKDAGPATGSPAPVAIVPNPEASRNSTPASGSDQPMPSSSDLLWARRVVEQLQDFAATAPQARELVERCRDALNDLKKVGMDKDFDSAVAFAPNGMRKQLFKIAANPKHKMFLTSETQSYQTMVAGLGEREVSLSPKDSFEVRVAAGALYSFVRNPSYKAASKNGQIVIEQTSNDYNELSGIIALNITRSEWAGQSFTPVLQLGVAPQSDNFALVLGVGFTSTTNVSFTLGAIYQKTTVLKEGLSVGQTLSSVDDLKTESKFKAGLYMGVNYEFK